MTKPDSRFSAIVLDWSLWIYVVMGVMLIFTGGLMVVFASVDGVYVNTFWQVFGRLTLTAIPPLVTGIAIWFRTALAVPFAWFTSLLYAIWYWGVDHANPIAGDPSASDRILDLMVLVAALILPPLLTIVWRKGHLKGRNT